MTRQAKQTFDNSPVFQRIEQTALQSGLVRLNQISQQIGISGTLLADIKYGRASLAKSHRKTLEKIANYLGMTISQVQVSSGGHGADRVTVDELSAAARYIAYMREKLKLNKRDAASYFGLGKNAFIEYELGKREPSLLLLLVFKILDDHANLIDLVDNLVRHPDPRQAHPTYFSYMRRKLKIRKRDAAYLFGLGKGTFTQIESGVRQPATLLLIIFKLIEHRPQLADEIKALSEAARMA
jgi:DNA-binding transcriptional regulator YiaG